MEYIIKGFTVLLMMEILSLGVLATIKARREDMEKEKI